MNAAYNHGSQGDLLSAAGVKDLGPNKDASKAPKVNLTTIPFETIIAPCVHIYWMLNFNV